MYKTKEEFSPVIGRHTSVVIVAMSHVATHDRYTGKTTCSVESLLRRSNAEVRWHVQQMGRFLTDPNKECFYSPNKTGHKLTNSLRFTQHQVQASKNIPSHDFNVCNIATKSKMHTRTGTWKHSTWKMQFGKYKYISVLSIQYIVRSSGRQKLARSLPVTTRPPSFLPFSLHSAFDPLWHFAPGIILSIKTSVQEEGDNCPPSCCQ